MLINLESHHITKSQRHNKKPRPEAKGGRVAFVFIALAFLLATVILRVLYFTTQNQEKYQNYSDNTFMRAIKLPAVRGRILDRNGAVLAISENRGNVIVDTNQLPDFVKLKADNAEKPKTLAKIVQQEQDFQKKVGQAALLLGISNDEAAKIFNYHTYDDKKKRGDVYVQRNIDEDLSKQLSELKLPGLRVLHTTQRRYPNGEDFGQIIGITKTEVLYKLKDEDDFKEIQDPEILKKAIANKNIEATVEKIIGLEGLERTNEKLLSGTDGVKMVIKNNRGEFIDSVDSPRNQAPIDGKDLTLTLDRNIQHLTMEALHKAVDFHQAKKAYAIVLDAKNGEILAMANYPTFNPQEFNKYPAENRKNTAMMDVIEPGSTAKPLIIMKTLDEGKVKPHTVLNTMPYTVGNKLIKDSHPYASLTVEGVIQKSSNVGSSKLSLMLPKEMVREHYVKIGLDSPTNAGLPAESTYPLRKLNNWTPLDQATMSYGYFPVNLLQLVRSYTVFTADGQLLPVTAIKSDTPAAGEQVIKPETARQMRKMMQSVTEKGGTGTRGAIDGYSVGAKSGTATLQVQYVGKDGKTRSRYDNTAHRGLFIGFAPVENPRLIVAVAVERPRANGYYGGVVAAPAFAEIMKGSLSLLGVPPDKPLLADEKKANKK